MGDVRLKALVEPTAAQVGVSLATGAGKAGLKTLGPGFKPETEGISCRRLKY